MITIICMLLVVIGAINWFSVGVFGFNFVNWIWTPQAYIGAQVTYAIVGLAGVWLIGYLIYNKFSPKRIKAVETCYAHRHDTTEE